ncbi:hypothetical protein U4132_20825, partial [Escherichia coli]|nr:hypothetical protein [Escherichia coli]
FSLWHLCCSEVSISPLFRWPNSVNHFSVYSQKLTLERDAEMLKTMQAAGVEVIYPDTGPFQKKAREVYSQFPEWTPGLYETIQQQLQ